MMSAPVASTTRHHRTAAVPRRVIVGVTTRAVNGGAMLVPTQLSLGSLRHAPRVKRTWPNRIAPGSRSLPTEPTVLEKHRPQMGLHRRRGPTDPRVSSRSPSESTVTVCEMTSEDRSTASLHMRPAGVAVSGNRRVSLIESTARSLGQFPCHGGLVAGRVGHKFMIGRVPAGRLRGRRWRRAGLLGPGCAGTSEWMQRLCRTGPVPGQPRR